jgi:hypothetical protein
VIGDYCLSVWALAAMSRGLLDERGLLSLSMDHNDQNHRLNIQHVLISAKTAYAEVSVVLNWNAD